MNRLTVYQVVSNGYDRVTPPKGHLGHFDYSAVLGQVSPDQAAVWNRFHKIKAPPERTAFSIYLDGNMRLKCEPAVLLANVDKWLVDADIAICRHAARKCAYVEIEACKWRKKITEDQAEVAHSRLAATEHPKNFGLWECGIIVRRSGVEWVRDLQNHWWDLIRESGVPRDQIWLPLALRRVPHPAGRFKTIEMDVRSNPLIDFGRHDK